MNIIQLTDLGKLNDTAARDITLNWCLHFRDRLKIPETMPDFQGADLNCNNKTLNFQRQNVFLRYIVRCLCIYNVLYYYLKALALSALQILQNNSLAENFLGEGCILKIYVSLYFFTCSSKVHNLQWKNVLANLSIGHEIRKIDSNFIF